MLGAGEHDPTPIIGTDDYTALLYAATVALRRGDANASFLIAELRRADIRRPDEVPDDVASVGSRVTFRVNGRAKAVTKIVVGEADAPRRNEVSVMTPLGAALLGLRAGDRMPFRARQNGPPWEVAVEAVEPYVLRPGRRR